MMTASKIVQSSDGNYPINPDVKAGFVQEYIHVRHQNGTLSLLASTKESSIDRIGDPECSSLYWWSKASIYTDI